MGIKSLLGFGQARDKPVRNYSNGEYSFNFGRSTSGKSVNEMTAMQTTAVYAYTTVWYQDTLQNKAMKLYQKCIAKPDSSLAARCCNFKMLEEKCSSYSDT